MRYFLFNIVLLSMAVVSHAQNEVWEKIHTKFPDAPTVFVERSETLNILVEGDSLKVYSDVLEDVLHLKSQTDLFYSKRVYGNHFNQVDNLKAKTLVWDRNKYKEMNVSDFKKNSDRQHGIFYDDSYYYSFNFPSVASGNRTHLQYREHVKNPRFISGFVFSSYMPQSKASFTIRTTRSVELVCEVMNDPGKSVSFRKIEKGDNVTYEWTVQDMPSVFTEEASPSVRYYAPHVVCYIKSYTTKANRKINVLSSLADLYKWYYTFVEKLNSASSPEMAAIVDKLKAGSRSESELVKNVFYWVQENIHYIAFEEGMRGFVPNSGSYVCEKRYGDCKDMANLIVNMLQLAGVKAYHTWIGTRDIPYKYTEFPTPVVDNHMIATYISADGAYYFLDATSDHTPFGFPSSMIQGKEALIGIDAERFEVKTVPIIERERNRMIDSLTVRVVNNTLEGSGAVTLSGYRKVFSGYELDRAEKDDIKRYVSRLTGKGSNKFNLSRYEVSGMDDRDQPTRVVYEFQLADYFQKLGDEIYINLHLNKDHYNAFINAEARKTPHEADYRYVKEEYITLAIPDGYAVEYLPPDASHDGALMGYEISYQEADGTIRYRKKLYVDYLLMQPSQFDAWNESVRRISDAYKESIILKKK